MTTNQTPIPEPTSPTAVVVAKLVASPKTGVDCCLWSKAFTGKYSMELGGFKIAPYNGPGPWLRGGETVMATLMDGSEPCAGTAPTRHRRVSPMSDAVTRARELLDKATPRPWNLDDVPYSLSQLHASNGDDLLSSYYESASFVRDGDAELIAAAPTLLAELADDVESERSLRIQMARELLVLTRAAELPDPSAEDFGGVGKRILAALEVES